MSAPCSDSPALDCLLLLLRRRRCKVSPELRERSVELAVAIANVRAAQSVGVSWSQTSMAEVLTVVTEPSARPGQWEDNDRAPQHRHHG